MEKCGFLFGRPISFPFLGQDMDQDRVIEALDIFQRLHQKLNVVPVDGADVFETKGLEEHPGCK